VNGRQKHWRKWLLQRIIVIGLIGRKKVKRTIRAVSPMTKNDTRRTLNGLSLIQMAGKYFQESQRLYYLSVNWLNLNMHSLYHFETKV